MTNQIINNRTIFQIGITNEEKISPDKSIVSSFFNLFQPKEDAEKNLTPIENLFNKAFNNKDYILLNKMLSEGYLINSNQKEMITIHFNNLIERNSIDEINQLIDNKIEPYPENIHKMFFNTYNSIYLSPIIVINEAKKIISENKLKELYNNFNDLNVDDKYKNTLHILQQYIKKDKDKLFKNWQYIVDNYPFSSNISFDYAIVKNLEVFIFDHIAKLSLDEKLALVAKIDSLNNTQSIIWNDVKSKLINSFSIEKEFYLKEIISNVNFEEQINLSKTTLLNKDIKEKINNINDLCQHMLKDNIEDIYRENIVKIGIKKTNEVIDKYFNIDAEFRSNVKSSQNKTSDELLADSIDNIYNSINDIYEEINKSKISDLSATNRYTKKI